MKSIKNETVIEMLKYALMDNTKLTRLQETLNVLNKLKKNEKNEKNEEKNTLKGIKIPNFSKPQYLFKKINMTFKSLSMLIKILLLRIDEKKYQESLDQKIIFPKNINTLIIVVGTFDKAFNQEITKMLFDLVTFSEYDDLYNISEINQLLIPFVANDQINELNLQTDFNNFSVLVKDFACAVLNLNIDLEHNDIIDIDPSFKDTDISNS
jgi:hypothetical protein